MRRQCAALHYPARPSGQGSGEALKGGSPLGRPADSIVDTMRLDSVLISDAVDQKCVQFLQDNGISVTYKTKMPLDELLKEIKVWRICSCIDAHLYFYLGILCSQIPQLAFEV